MASAQSKQLRSILEKLEAEYGTLVPSDDPVEAGVMAVLAATAPRFSRPDVRDLLRDAFVDWNEARVADPWDVSHAIQSKGHGEARKFSRAMLRMLKSLHGKLNRCAFDRILRDPAPPISIPQLVEKMRGVPPYAKTVILAALDPAGGWHPRAEVSKLVQKLKLVPKTSSLAKVAKSLEAIADPDDRLRAHYLLTRYANRSADDADPLAPGGGADAAKKSGAKKKTTKQAAAKKVTKATAKKTTKSAAKKATRKAVAKPAKKAAAKKAAAKKKVAKKTTKKAAKKTASRAAKK
jgi:hypothetical protein